LLNKRLKYGIVLVTYTISLYFLFNNFKVVCDLLEKLRGIIAPFIYGFVIAYLVNWPYVFLMKKAFLNKSLKIKKFFSILLAYLLFFGMIGFLIAIVIPQLIESLDLLIKKLYDIFSRKENIIRYLLNKFNINPDIEKNIIEFLNKTSGSLEQLTGRMVLPVCEATTKFVMEFYYLSMGCAVSIYLLAEKEKLILQCIKIRDSFIPKGKSEFITEVLKLSHKKIGKFFVGKFLDSLIIGTLCFLCASVARTPYPVLVSFIIGFTNILPFFGPIIGMVVSALIVLTVNPAKTFWCIIYVFILQQIDGNIIGPKIIGNAIGLSGLWIMFSVILGGGFFGFTGMILGVPIFSVIYIIFGRYINNKLSNKTVKEG